MRSRHSGKRRFSDEDAEDIPGFDLTLNLSDMVGIDGCVWKRACGSSSRAARSRLMDRTNAPCSTHPPRRTSGSLSRFIREADKKMAVDAMTEGRQRVRISVALSSRPPLLSEVVDLVEDDEADGAEAGPQNESGDEDEVGLSPVKANALVVRPMFSGSQPLDHGRLDQASPVRVVVSVTDKATRLEGTPAKSPSTGAKAAMAGARLGSRAGAAHREEDDGASVELVVAEPPVKPKASAAAAAAGAKAADKKPSAAAAPSSKAVAAGPGKGKSSAAPPAKAKDLQAASSGRRAVVIDIDDDEEDGVGVEAEPPAKPSAPARPSASAKPAVAPAKQVSAPVRSAGLAKSAAPAKTASAPAEEEDLISPAKRKRAHVLDDDDDDDSKGAPDVEEAKPPAAKPRRLIRGASAAEGSDRASPLVVDLSGEPERAPAAARRAASQPAAANKKGLELSQSQSQRASRPAAAADDSSQGEDPYSSAKPVATARQTAKAVDVKPQAAPPSRLAAKLKEPAKSNGNEVKREPPAARGKQTKAGAAAAAASAAATAGTTAKAQTVATRAAQGWGRAAAVAEDDAETGDGEDAGDDDGVPLSNVRATADAQVQAGEADEGVYEIKVSATGQLLSPDSATAPRTQRVHSLVLEDGVYYFEVEWKGFPDAKDRTWEPQESFVDSSPDVLAQLRDVVREHEKRRRTKVNRSKLPLLY